MSLDQTQIKFLKTIQDAFSIPVGTLEKQYPLKDELPLLQNLRDNFQKKALYDRILFSINKDLNKNFIKRFFTDLFRGVTPEGLEHLRQYFFAYLHALFLINNELRTRSLNDLENNIINTIFWSHLQGMSLRSKIFNNEASEIFMEYAPHYSMNTKPIRLDKNHQLIVVLQTGALEFASNAVVTPEFHHEQNKQENEARLKMEERLKELGDLTEKKLKIAAMVNSLKRHHASVDRESRSSVVGVDRNTLFSHPAESDRINTTNAAASVQNTGEDSYASSMKTENITGQSTL